MHEKHLSPTNAARWFPLYLRYVSRARAQAEDKRGEKDDPQRPSGGKRPPIKSNPKRNYSRNSLCIISRGDRRRLDDLRTGPIDHVSFRHLSSNHPTADPARGPQVGASSPSCREPTRAAPFAG